jgi:hypothetical protein
VNFGHARGPMLAAALMLIVTSGCGVDDQAATTRHVPPHGEPKPSQRRTVSLRIAQLERAAKRYDAALARCGTGSRRAPPSTGGYRECAKTAGRSYARTAAQVNSALRSLVGSAALSCRRALKGLRTVLLRVDRAYALLLKSTAAIGAQGVGSPPSFYRRDQRARRAATRTLLTFYEVAAAARRRCH